MDKPVVVGVDGSGDACQAVCWAAVEAQRRGAPLLVVHAWGWPPYTVPLGLAPIAAPEAALEEAARAVVAEAAAQAAEAAPGLAIDTRLLTGDAASRLIETSREASLLVLGHRGLGGFAGLLLGSVGISASSHAACPVAVVRGRPEPTGPVLVGIDGPKHSQHTIDAAFAEARRMGTGVLALHTFEIPRPHVRGFADRVSQTVEPVLPEAPDLDHAYADHLMVVEDDARALVEQEITGARQDYPEIPVQIHVGTDSAARELVAASEHASLVVVGVRGSGGFAGLVLGTTSHALIHHAHCPVLVDR